MSHAAADGSVPVWASIGEAGERHGPYDVLHSHYWVSGWVARLARERWGSPVAHSFHTLDTRGR